MADEPNNDDDQIALTDAEFETLMDIGHALADALSEFDKDGRGVDTGLGAGEYEAFVTVGDVEYKACVRAYCRPSEVEEWAQSLDEPAA